MEKKRGLGRGLGALLSSPETLLEGADVIDSEEGLTKLPIDQIQPGQYQPRSDIDPESLKELASSIESHGLMQPIVVRKYGIQHYEIIAGERRWRACQLLGLKEIPAIIRNATDEQASALALIENIQRENLNVIEEATAYARLLEEFGLTHQQIADSVGKSRTTITNILRLMGLCAEVKELLANQSIEMGHARALLPLEAEQQIEAARIIISNTLSVRQTEQLVRKLQSNRKLIDNGGEPEEEDADILQLQRELSEKLAAVVNIKHRASGKGTLAIKYHSVDELQGILSRIS